MCVAEHDQDNTQQQTEESVTDLPLPDLEEEELPAQTIYHIYVVKEPVPDDTLPIVEQANQPGQQYNKLVSLAILLCFLFAGLGMGMLSPFLLSPSVTITIIPAQKTLTTTQTIPLVSQTLQTRQLPTLIMSQQQTSKTTGREHQDATPAYGEIIFYNAAPNDQTIAQGTLFLTGSGIQVVTDEIAVIPAAIFPTMGHVTVAAHTLQTGTYTNLPALAINTACCVVNVFARNNTAFAGGQEARSFPVVTQGDIERALASVTTSLQHSISAALQTHLKEHEGIVTQQPCPTTNTSTHPVGSEAKEITVTVTMTCQAYSYNTHALLYLLLQTQTQESIRQFGSGFRLAGTLHIETMQLTTKQQIHFLTVQTKGIWLYQFTTEHLDKLAQQIAGKSTQQVTALLLQTPFVRKVSFGEGVTTLPHDATRIHLVVVS